MHTEITLPSGISITQAKKDAKKLKKQNSGLSHSQALEFILLQNGFNGGWNKFMSKTKSQTQHAGSRDPHRNLLVLAINYLVENSLISLETPDDYQDRQLDPTGESRERGHVITTIAGRNTVICWADIGHEELRVSVWWDYDHSKHPQANNIGSYKERFQTASPLAKRSKFKNFVGVVCSGWLERQEGKYLQGRMRKNLFQIYTRKENLEPLKKIQTTKSLGYYSEGNFHR